MALAKSQARYYKLLTSLRLQHLLLGFAIFIIVSGFFAFRATFRGFQMDIEDLEFWEGVLGVPRDLPVYTFIYAIKEGLIYTLVMGIPVYINYFLIYKNGFYRNFLGRYMSKERIRNWELYFFLIASGAMALLFTYPVYWFLSENLTIIESKFWHHSLVSIYLLTILTTAISYQKDKNEQERLLERKERQEAIDRRKDAERELQFIKKQIRPHFLFNTLQNLQILAKKKSDVLPDLMLELATLLRYLIYRTNTKLVKLQDELDFIQSYINLSSVQLSDTNGLHFEVQGELEEDFEIAPMIILNIVENCFKHSNPAPNGEKRIIITIVIKEGRLDLITKNTYKANVVNENEIENQKADGGLGLQSAKRYLDYMYEDNYVLETASKGPIFETHLNVPLIRPSTDLEYIKAQERLKELQID